MRCVVIYFSQTGNTEKIAKAIQTGVKQAANHCDIIKIEDANPLRLYEYDLIGIGSPVFGGQLGNVGIFVNNLRFVGGIHAFAFCTHGTYSEGYFSSMFQSLKRRGLVVIGMADWYGSVYLLHMPHPFPTDGHPDEIDLKEAKAFGREMVERSRRISAGETQLIPPDPPALPPNAEGKRPASFSSAVKFNKELCRYPKCRICMDNCPVHGIDLSMNPPVIAKPCIDCEFCLKICPTGALNADAFIENMAKGAREGLSKFLLSNLEKAEKEGHFRRLVPLDKISYENLLYKIHTKHPQWIIGKGLQ